MIRGLAITDALAYVSFRSKAPINEAIGNSSGIASKPGLIDLFGRSAWPDQRRLTWVSIDEGQMNGILSVRNRPAADIWDVEQLASTATNKSVEVYFDLLSHAVSRAYVEGVQRVFLRVGVDSKAEEGARRAGFCRYTGEIVYGIDADYSPPLTGAIGFRPRRRVDHLALFRLYCSAVPLRVRQIEGLTLQEWRATDGWRLYPICWRVNLPYGRRDLLVEEDQALVAWLQIEQRTGVRQLLIRPSWSGSIDDLVARSLFQTKNRKSLFFPVREYQEGLSQYLAAQGFPIVARHSLMSRSLAVRIPEPKLVPVRARAQ